MQVTGGMELYRRYSVYSMYSTVTRSDGTTFNIAEYHSRTGDTVTDVDAGRDSHISGVSNGIGWEYSPKTGARILGGRIGERRLADSRGLDADDWRRRFPEVNAIGLQTIEGQVCQHVKLKRADGSTVERFYAVQSGRLIREVSTDFDDAGLEQPVTTEVMEYETTLGITHPSLLRVREGSKTFTVHIDSLNFGAASLHSFDIPHEVARALAERRRPMGLPNALDLVEHFIDVTGGKDAYRAIQTQAVRGEMTFAGQAAKVPLVFYAMKGKMYMSLDMPSIGKFEYGSDGKTGWQRSVVLGPKLEPSSRVGGFLGPDANRILSWAESGAALETVGKDQVNGSACYKIAVGAEAPVESSLCFDEQTGLLVKATGPVLENGRIVSLETTFADYQAHNGFRTPHHLETEIAGKQGTIDIRQMTINEPLPDGVFDLPPDVRALREKRLKDAQTEGTDSETRPSLRRKR
jgi:hypothetical protein